MSTEQDRARELAERIARRLAGAREGQGGARHAAAQGDIRSNNGGDLGALSATLSEIQRRLAHIEAHISHEGECEHDGRRGESSSSAASFAPTARRQQQSNQDSKGTGFGPTSLSGTYVSAVSHPSQERFADIGEAVSELVEFFEREKTCNVEPGGKPCDHCGMCSRAGSENTLAGQRSDSTRAVRRVVLKRDPPIPLAVLFFPTQLKPEGRFVRSGPSVFVRGGIQRAGACALTARVPPQDSELICGACRAPSSALKSGSS